ncbi:hypothetical protein ABIA33_006974 [Streptacidiphilus sp. MAP12-16]
MSEAAAVHAPRIVVGVDGSEPSKAALRWAVRQAELTGDALVAVTAWDFPHNWTGWSPPGEPSFDWEDSARKILTETIDEAIGPDHPVEIGTRVVQGHPAGCWTKPRAPRCWLWGTAGTAGSPKPCSAPSDSTSPTMPPVPSSSSAARNPAEADTR